MLQPLLEIFTPYRDGAIFDPSTERDTKIITGLLNIKPRDKAVDLGSGDGRIVIEMAKRGADAYGLERDPKLIRESRQKISRKGLDERACIIPMNFWEENLSPFNKIAVYQYHTVMNRLEQKLIMEVNKGTYIVSHRWKFPNWEISRQIEDIYLYIKK